MQRHSTSYPQAVLFLDTQTQGCISFEQLGSRLKVRWIISAAKLCLAIITGPPHRKWQAKSQNVLGRNHGSDLCNPDSLPSQAQGAPKAEKQNQNNGSAGCISSSSTSTPEPQAGSSQSEQHTGHTRCQVALGHSNRRLWTKQILCFALVRQNFKTNLKLLLFLMM